MSDSWVVGRRAIIALLKVPLRLSDDEETAWNKIRRWRKRYGIDRLFHHLPSGHVYVDKMEIQAWLNAMFVKLD